MPGRDNTICICLSGGVAPRQADEKVTARLALEHPAWIAAYVVVAHTQWDDLNVYLRHGGQQRGNARVLLLRVDANRDRNWRLFRHRLYGFSSLLM
jgi:hypothetical protein